MADETEKKLTRKQREQQRQEILKDLILRLHAGEDQASIKAEFAEHFTNVSAFEIAVMERRLMAQEGIKAEEIMRLCNVHASLFADVVAAPKNVSPETEKIGHPIQVLKTENLAIEATLDRIDNLLAVYLEAPDAELKHGLENQLRLLGEIDKHYARKENSFFPIMERYGLTAPPQVMWGVDDKIRNMLAEFRTSLADDERDQLAEQFAELKYEIEEMVVKEEDIMIPMVLDVFNEDDWIAIAGDATADGWCIVKPERVWEPSRTTFTTTKAVATALDGNVPIGSGHLNAKEIEKIMNALPLEITWVDVNDNVKYYNESPGEKFFARTKSAIGREVLNCHPPKVHDTVTKLLADLRSGKKDSETMWFQAMGKFIMVTYMAVRDDDGTFMGTLEYVQDIAPIKALAGEKRELSD